MAAPDEPSVDAPEAPAPTIADRLAAFLKEHAEALPAGETYYHELAGHVLKDFFRTDVDADSIYGIPGVDSETLEGFAMVHWGPMAGRLSPDKLRALGSAFIETAEMADLDSAMMRWLLREPGASREGAIKILGSFRSFRAELDEPEAPAGPAA